MTYYTLFSLVEHKFDYNVHTVVNGEGIVASNFVKVVNFVIKVLFIALFGTQYTLYIHYSEIEMNPTVSYCKINDLITAPQLGLVLTCIVSIGF